MIFAAFVYALSARAGGLAFLQEAHVLAADR
jgi:hypothetical protein